MPQHRRMLACIVYGVFHMDSVFEFERDADLLVLFSMRVPVRGACIRPCTQPTMMFAVVVAI